MNLEYLNVKRYITVANKHRIDIDVPIYDILDSANISVSSTVSLVSLKVPVTSTNTEKLVK